MMEPKLEMPWPKPKREDHILKLMQSRPSETWPLKFQSRTQALGLHVVPISLPVYRLESGRTGAAQREHVETHNKPDDFFTRDPESVEALSVQHELLKKLANKRQLLNYFRDNEQVDPLILTGEGYVVNGNRRLCAMRILLEEELGKYEHFNHVRVVFLPPCSEEDIAELESQLQIQPDIKDEYTWVSSALLMRKQIEKLGWDYDRVARVHEMTKRRVRLYIDLLDHAEQYLAKRGMPRRYTRVEPHEFAFKKLRLGRENLTDGAEKDVFTELSYSLIDVPDEAGGRLYDLIPAVQEHLSDIVDEIEKELEVAEGEADAAPKDATSDSGATLLAGEGSEVGRHPRLASVARTVADPTNRTRVITIVQDVIQRAKQLERDRDSTDFPQRQVAQAHTCLFAAYSHLVSDSNTEGMEAQLKNIEDLLKKLRVALSSHAQN